ncbi:hypothetical protein BDV98DRAFT_591112 [Pterulicium gracile]|uniref:Uncharacterized protein n=1 Tax=Pterulicium gracile TaxID=1884261 RepID=A0A5C3QTX4_9AGAR|nr:hypothetical protein BDV98DRAFT_591112 [Pterula gracilis]
MQAARHIRQCLNVPPTTQIHATSLLSPEEITDPAVDTQLIEVTRDLMHRILSAHPPIQAVAIRSGMKTLVLESRSERTGTVTGTLHPLYLNRADASLSPVYIKYCVDEDYSSDASDASEIEEPDLEYDLDASSSEEEDTDLDTSVGHSSDWE